MTPEPPSLTHVSDTALWVAYYRATESERADALFHDPFAKALAGERGRKIAESMKDTSRYTAWILAIRTRVIDELIYAKIREGVDTILNLGSGLDARPYRMELPAALRWIEVDYPQIFDHKTGILQREKPRCQLECFSLDLGDREARSSCFSTVAARSTNTLVLTEGVIPYLAESEVSDLASDLHLYDAFRFWIIEYLSRHALQILQ